MPFRTAYAIIYLWLAKERLPKTKILTHTAAAIGGVAVGYLGQRRRLARMRQENQAARVKALRLKHEVKRAEIDDVTRLPRRSAITEAYEGLVNAPPERKRTAEKVARPNDKHSIMLIDLDHFHDFNYANGHNKGDEILHLVSGVMIDRLRERDVIARWGGEEFAVLLPRASETDAAAVAEELRQSIDATGQIQASIGVAELNLDHPLKDNVDRADRALYAAKENGRNQVVTYSSL